MLTDSNVVYVLRFVSWQRTVEFDVSTSQNDFTTWTSCLLTGTGTAARWHCRCPLLVTAMPQISKRNVVSSTTVLRFLCLLQDRHRSSQPCHTGLTDYCTVAFWLKGHYAVVPTSKICCIPTIANIILSLSLLIRIIVVISRRHIVNSVAKHV